MTQTTGRGQERIGSSTPALDGSVAPPSGRLARLQERLSRPGYAEVLLGLLSALFFTWRVAKPSPWWDEAITRDVTSRSASEILDLSEHVDLVHTTYYLLVHALLGSSATVTPIRLLSVAAAAATTALLVWLGRELGSARVGVLAALLWTVAPLVSRYAQEARPYAMVALATTAATLALVRVCRRPWLRARWAIYLFTLVAVGMLNILALLVLIAHLSYVLTNASTTVRRRWYLAIGGALALLSPLLIAASRQKDQVAWLPRPAFDRLTGFLIAEYATDLTVIAVLVIAIIGLSRGTHRSALGLGVAWSLLPTVALWVISQVHPLYDWRYVFFTMPGTALGLASVATLLRRRWLLIVVAVLAFGGLHMQNVYRTTSGHGENIRGVAQVIAAKAQPGDAVLFLPASRRVVELAYPDDFRGVDDIALAGDGEQTATLWGVERSSEEIRAELRKRNRVWVVTGAKRIGELASDPGDEEKEEALYNGYRMAGVTFVNRYELRLYVRDPLPIVPGTATSS